MIDIFELIILIMLGIMDVTVLLFFIIFLIGAISHEKS